MVNKEDLCQIIFLFDNDSGMARFADIVIGFGSVRNIVPSLLRNIGYAFYDDKKSLELKKFLYDTLEGQIMKNDLTIVISCAGMGTRLGLGTTKALINVEGKPLIIHQLEMLEGYNDIRIVVGYQADKVIETVEEYRKDITFVFNYDYKTTGTGASFSKGIIDASKYVVSFDGDLLVNPSDLNTFLDYEGECVGGCEPTTDNPVLMTLNDKNQIVGFSRDCGELEWTGLAKLKTNRLNPGKGHVYEMIEPLMPIDVVKIRTKEIDTFNDYENAIRWLRNGYTD